jgi:signal transduction histidine kinase
LTGSHNPLRPGRVSTIAIYLAYAAIAAQILVRVTDRELLPKYFFLLAGFILLFTSTLFISRVQHLLFHAYFAIQSTIVLITLSLDPNSDVVTGLFALLCYQAAIFFSDRSRWGWIATLVALTIGSLVYFLGPLRGVALGLTPAGIAFALAFLVFANQESETARIKSQALLSELEEKRVQIEARAKKVEELAAVEERNRLARELHDAVSQTMFSITLTARSAQMQVESDPTKIRPLLEQLQTLTNDTLTNLRNMVAKLRPPATSSN